MSEKISSLELRKKWNEFWLSKKHTYLPEVSLVAEKGSTAMFNLAGMQQLIPYLMGKDHILGGMLFNIQKCIRTNDIEEVGDNRHLTFFEMMGNWSLGTYFKKDAVEWSYEFLVNCIKIDPKKLAVTVFEGDDNAPRDEETANYWKNAGISDHKISYMGAKDNWWSPGPVGPCGSDTEIFYRIGKNEFPPMSSNIKDDEDNWMEIWNNVFMEFYRDESGKLTKLSKQNVDTGMGFERMSMVLQNVETVFETDIFWPMIDYMQNQIKLNYSQNSKRYRIIADHIRSSMFLIRDGVVPSNEKRGYILRRLIRRAYFNMRQLLADANKGNYKYDNLFIEMFLNDIFEIIVSIFGESAGNLGLFKNSILNEIKKEFENFEKTLSKGFLILNDLIAKSEKISGKDVFMLYDTYGFPSELTIELINDKNKSTLYDIENIIKEFELEKEKNKEKSREGSKEMFKKGIDWSKYIEGLPQTEFVGYENFSLENVKLLKDFEIEGQRVLIFDKTPFYAESGGQIGDRGIFVDNSGEVLNIGNVIKYAGVFLHLVS